MNIEQLKKNTAKVVTRKDNNDSHVVLTNSYLRFTNKAIEQLNINEGDKVWLAFNSVTEPILVIKTDNGNILNGKTVACSGAFNASLKEIGTKFSLEKIEDNIFSLLPYVEAEDICD